MPLDFRDGAFRVSCCKRGHVTLEVLDGDAVKFVAVMSSDEAADLAARLSGAASFRVRRRKVH